jgi:hypothetical protein
MLTAVPGITELFKIIDGLAVEFFKFFEIEFTTDFTKSNFIPF